MKKFLGLFMAAALLVSCSDDDSSSSVSESQLAAGKWYYSNTKYSAAGQSETETYDHSCATSKDYITFSNGVYTDVYHFSDCETSTSTSTYTLDGKTLTIAGDGAYTVKTASSSKLVLETKETISGVTFTYTDTYTSN
jgi:hypothetical protein